MVYIKESEKHHLPTFYYLVLKKRYTKEKNTQKSVLDIQYL